MLFLTLTEVHRSKGSALAPWPARLTTPPPRLADLGYSDDMFIKDTVISHEAYITSSSLHGACMKKLA